MAGPNNNYQRIEPRFDSPKQQNRPSKTKKGGEPGNIKQNPSIRRKGSAKSKKSAGSSRRSGIFWLFRRTVYWSLVLSIWGAIGIGIMVAYYGVKLPNSANWKIPQRPPNVRIVSVEGKLITNRGVTGGSAMALKDMSPYLPMAVIAIEDHRFKRHFGVDPIGIARAMAMNITSGHLVQGGSTLTQQLAKNLFLEPKRDLGRKIQEAILALWLEHKFTKDEILELYLNRVYFGSGAYGVDAAARRYFSKSARDVNLAEAAMLAGLLKAPSKLSPAKNPKGAEARAQVVLAAMRREGFVTDREVTTALSMEAKKAKHFWSGSEHYVADLVMKQLPVILGDVKGDIIVDTTVDFDLQKKAGELIKQTLAKNGKKLNVSQGAMVSLDGTGAIRAMVGGVEYADSQFNRAVDAKRQPGSAFKPIVYLTALKQGLNPDTVRIDRPIKIGSWSPENYDKKYRGPVTLSEALSKSLNTISAQMVREFGAKRVIETAHSLGIHTKLANNASIALGTSEVSLLELTSAYAPFSNGGYLAEPFIIKRVTSYDGKVLYERGGTNAPRVLKSNLVGMMNEMLTRVVDEGTGKAARVKHWQVAGKTGTTQNFRDALFVGYTANLITGVWYGNDNGKPTKKVTGGSLPARTFAAFMKTAHNGLPGGELPGYYLPPTVSIIPTPRPDINRLQPFGISKSAKTATQGNQASVSTITTGTPRPSADLSSESPRKKPKNILDLLLGG